MIMMMIMLMVGCRWCFVMGERSSDTNIAFFSERKKAKKKKKRKMKMKMEINKLIKIKKRTKK